MTYIQPHVPEGHDVLVFYGVGPDTARSGEPSGDGLAGKFGVIDAESGAYVRFAAGSGHARDLQGAILGLPRTGSAHTARRVDFERRWKERDDLARFSPDKKTQAQKTA